MKAFVSVAIELSDDELFVVFRRNMIAQSKVIDEKKVRFGSQCEKGKFCPSHDEITNRRFSFVSASSCDCVISLDEQMRKYFMHVLEGRRTQAGRERKGSFLSFTVDLFSMMK
jgi:hypothetical protein